MPSDAKESTRLEALSDGVFAVAITLLVLEIHPQALGPDESLTHSLLKEWPSFLGFVLSFATIGVMWMNHHRIFRRIVRYEEGLAIVNGLLLLLVTFTPFPTAIFAQNLTNVHGPGAAAFYSANFVALAIAFNLLSAYIVRHNLLAHSDEAQQMALMLRKRYWLGPGLYAVLTAIAFANVYACLVGHIVLAIYWAIPSRPQTEAKKSTT